MVYEASLKRIRDRLTKLCDEVRRLPTEVGGSWIEHRLVTMSKTRPEAPHIARMIKDYKARAGIR